MSNREITFKTLRAKQKLTGEQLAKIAGIGIKTYQSYEQNYRSPSSKNLNKLKYALNCSDEDLMRALTLNIYYKEEKEKRKKK